jgi:hypothetical protein
VVGGFEKSGRGTVAFLFSFGAGGGTGTLPGEESLPVTIFSSRAGESMVGGAGGGCEGGTLRVDPATGKAGGTTAAEAMDSDGESGFGNGEMGAAATDSSFGATAGGEGGAEPGDETSSRLGGKTSRATSAIFIFRR